MKKVKIGLILFIGLFCTLINVQATTLSNDKIITFNEVGATSMTTNRIVLAVEKYHDTTQDEILRDFFYNNVNITSTENEIIFNYTKDDETPLNIDSIFSFENGLINYVLLNDFAPETEEGSIQALLGSIWAYSILGALLNINGYTNEQIDYGIYGDANTERDPELNNFVGLTSTIGEYSNESESSSITYTYIENLSINVADFNFTEEIQNQIFEYNEMKPSIELLEITNDSISIKTNVETTNENVSCIIYRSTDGINYVELNQRINCSEAITLIDPNLLSNTNYYYKTRVLYGTQYSETKIATTLNLNNNVNQNPQTGIPSYNIIMILIMIVTIVIYGYVKNKNKFYKL